MSITSNYPSVLPSLNLDFANSKSLDSRITFTRVSVATYYDGKSTVKTGENLFLYSQDFSNPVWSQSTVNVTANIATAPDGSLTAEKIAAKSATGYHYTNQFSLVNIGLQYVVSFYVKSAEYTKLTIAEGGNALFFAQLNLTTATVSNVYGFTSTSIASAGNGWYRFVGLFTPIVGSISTSIIGIPDTGVTNTGFGSQYAGDGVSGVYIWGAQLEQRSQITAYTPTTSSPITNYIPLLQTAPVGVPRFDHDPTTGESKGLLIEDQRVNLLTYSDSVTNWLDKGPGIVSENVMISPDGSMSADYFTKTSSTPTTWCDVGHYANVGAGGNSGKTYTYSVWLWVPYGTASCTLQISDRYYNTLPGNSITITTIPTRYSFTSSGPAGGWNAAGSMIGGGITGLPLNSPVYIWGAQLEVGASTTSYIPTTSSQATRAADNATISEVYFTNWYSSWYRQDEGTFCVKVTINNVSTPYARVIWLDDTTQNTYVNNHNITVIGGAYYASTSLGSTSQASLSVSGAVTGSSKCLAYAYSANNFGFSAAGSLPTTSSSGSIPSSINMLRIGYHRDGTSLNSHIQRITYYPKRLSNSELQSLTI